MKNKIRILLIFILCISMLTLSAVPAYASDASTSLTNRFKRLNLDSVSLNAYGYDLQIDNEEVILSFTDVEGKLNVITCIENVDGSETTFGYIDGQLIDIAKVTPGLGYYEYSKVETINANNLTNIEFEKH